MVGLTVVENVPFPIPVTVLPLFSVNVHAPLAVTVPVISVLLPLHIEVFPLVIVAAGRAFTVKTAVADVAGEQPVVETTTL